MNANLWRITDDFWDNWRLLYPEFERLNSWTPFRAPGHWPDADMLPLGSLRPSAGWGESRESRLTKEEQRSLLTLWCIVRSPLIMGGNLAALQRDPWTTSLLTNDAVLAVDQHAKDSRAAIQTENSAVWVSRPAEGPGYYVAVFNLSDQAQTLQYHWTELGLAAGQYKVHDLWEHSEAGPIALLKLKLSPHASTLYKIIPQ